MRPQEAVTTERRARVLQLLRTAGPLTVPQIADWLEVKRVDLRTDMRLLLDAEHIRVLGTTTDRTRARIYAAV